MFLLKNKGKTAIEGVKMQKNEKSKNMLLIVLFISLITLSIAYATLTQYLYINSEATIAGQGSGGWDIRFTAVTCHATGHASITQDFSMSATNLSGLEYRLVAPGDSIICNISVANNGSIDAKLSSFAIQDGNLTYTGSGASRLSDELLVSGKVQHSIVYATGDSQEGLVPSINDYLPSGVTRNLVLTIQYPSNANLPENDVVVTGLKTTFLYVQD